ncbi:MAG: RNase adapter RapZ [Clostridia bacterium]|nr:RNase adapter RapZ [Clostridia bacterium]
MYLLIVTGMSGAGKSLALKSAEDFGFFCVDNLPSPMLGEFIRMCENAVPQIERAAVTIDSRESLLSHNSHAVAEELKRIAVPHDILFLDARTEVLRRRYNETRRRHPLGEAGEAESGVAAERGYLGELRELATRIIDTSDVPARKFSKLIEKILPEFSTDEMSLIVSSFGYKRGVPIDADFVVDMRFADNPFYYESMRPLSGLDAEVSSFVLEQPFVMEYLDDLQKNILRMIPLFEAQDKHILRVCFGCTGGRHRSVAAAEAFAKRMRLAGQSVRIFHRDLVREEEDITERFGKKV